MGARASSVVGAGAAPVALDQAGRFARPAAEWLFFSGAAAFVTHAGVTHDGEEALVEARRRRAARFPVTLLTAVAAAVFGMTFWVAPLGAKPDTAPPEKAPPEKTAPDNDSPRKAPPQRTPADKGDPDKDDGGNADPDKSGRGDKPALPKPDKADPKELKNDIPSPAELMKQLRAEKERKSKQPKVVYFDLSENVPDGPAAFSLFGDDRLNVRTLVERIGKAAADKNVKGLLITLGDPGFNPSQAMEVRDALLQFRKSGKPAFVYADSYDTVTYLVASGASDVCMLEGGEIMMPGVSMEAMFARGLLDKLGVKADYVQIGEFKGADEELHPHRGQQGAARRDEQAHRVALQPHHRQHRRIAQAAARRGQADDRRDDPDRRQRQEPRVRRSPGGPGRPARPDDQEARRQRQRRGGPGQGLRPPAARGDRLRPTRWRSCSR